MEDELEGKGGRETRDGADEIVREEMKGVERGRPVGDRVKERTWQPIRFVNKTEGGTKNEAKPQP